MSIAETRAGTGTVVVGWVLAAAMVVALVLVGLNPQHVETAIEGPLFRRLLWFQQQPEWAWITFTVVERAANVAMFIPIGVVAFLVVPRRAWPTAFLVGPACSLAIEAAQRYLLDARDGSLSDLLMNSAGATIGVLLAAAVTALVTRRDPARIRRMRSRRPTSAVPPAPGA